ncbi:MAG: hypothetical protein RMZ41_001355 [Nostoc sp. DedVER02]|uniref:hypothetical protein n=1 Tax=unclassified Nostoc TaxID=2593658 RepID=UPI002AD225CD|nr:MULTISPECIES: hypothetical protein [unclassified Nostoc]MDZ7987190.1 hypothetical protein [Nostoc sp. DedVER02]MDZ8110939.1 hypothetical protein [Nostoc sp. DedVER01b]
MRIIKRDKLFAVKRQLASSPLRVMPPARQGQTVVTQEGKPPDARGLANAALWR